MSVMHLRSISGAVSNALWDRSISDSDGLTYTMADVTCPACKSLVQTIVPPDEAQKPESDPVSHPSHYTSHPSGIEPLTITKHEDFLTGNALKYIMRHRYKGAPVEDLRKAIFYLERRIEMLQSDD